MIVCQIEPALMDPEFTRKRTFVTNLLIKIWVVKNHLLVAHSWNSTRAIQTLLTDSATARINILEFRVQLLIGKNRINAFGCLIRYETSVNK